jgi:hypothetical protein
MTTFELLHRALSVPEGNDISIFILKTILHLYWNKMDDKSL